MSDESREPKQQSCWNHDQLVGLIWNIANKLLGSYCPSQYRRMMLPMAVLSRMDCVEKRTVSNFSCRLCSMSDGWSQKNC